MNDADLVGSTDFTIEVKAVGRARGYPADHRLLSGALNRRVFGLLASGHIPAVRVNRRFRVERSLAPAAADLLGLTPLAQPTSAAA